MRRFLHAAPLLLIACTGTPSLNEPAVTDQNFDLERFFDGRVAAHGHCQDFLGTLRRQFTVTNNGRWDGETLRLVEDFVYEDGATEQRIWTLVRTGNDTWSGTAPV